MSEQMSACNQCGEQYPSAPPFVLHKCGKCSGGMCAPLPPNALLPTEEVVTPAMIEAGMAYLRKAGSLSMIDVAKFYTAMRALAKPDEGVIPSQALATEAGA